MIGYYTPFAILSSVMMATGAGLFTTWTTSTAAGQWICYQIIAGLGVGFGFQQTMLAAQTCLPKEDVPIGTAIVIFFQTLGGALFVSVSQNVFTNRLVSGLIEVVPELDPQVVLESGATTLADVVEEALLDSVKVVYNDALVGAFYVATALSAMSILGSAALEWKSVRGQDVHVTAMA